MHGTELHYCKFGKLVPQFFFKTAWRVLHSMMDSNPKYYASKTPVIFVTLHIHPPNWKLYSANVVSIIAPPRFATTLPFRVPCTHSRRVWSRQRATEVSNARRIPATWKACQCRRRTAHLPRNARLDLTPRLMFWPWRGLPMILVCTRAVLAIVFWIRCKNITLFFVFPQNARVGWCVIGSQLPSSCSG